MLHYLTAHTGPLAAAPGVARGPAIYTRSLAGPLNTPAPLPTTILAESHFVATLVRGTNPRPSHPIAVVNLLYFLLAKHIFTAVAGSTTFLTRAGYCMATRAATILATATEGARTGTRQVISHRESLIHSFKGMENATLKQTYF